MSIERNMVVGRVLRKLRDARGLKQADLAMRLGRRQSFVSKIENGERELSLAEVYSYALALESDWHLIVDEVHVRLEDEGFVGLPLDDSASTPEEDGSPNEP